MKKVIIIGAGTSGLFCGALLSKNGYQVEVYEKTSNIGGRAMCIEKNGFILDYGLHVMRNGEKGFIASLLKEVNANVDMISISEPEILYFENKKFHEYPGDIKKFIQSDFGEENDKNILFSSIVQPDIVEKNMEKSILEWIKENNLSNKIERFLKLASLAIVCPFIEKASAGELFDVIRRKVLLDYPKIAYPVGGFGEIHKKLSDIILSNGGYIFTRKKVNGIIVENKRCIGVYTNGEKKLSDIVICTLLPKDIFDILDEKLISPQKVNFLKNILPTCGVSIDYCLRDKITDIDEIIISVEDLNIIGIVTSNIDPSVAPCGKQLLTFVAITNQDEVNRKTAEKLEEKIKEMFPEIQDNIIEYKRILHLPVIDGVELNVYQSRNKRPSPSFLEIENLFLAGDWLCGEGAGGDIAPTSAKLCVEEIRKKYG